MSSAEFEKALVELLRKNLHIEVSHTPNDPEGSVALRYTDTKVTLYYKDTKLSEATL